MTKGMKQGFIMILMAEGLDNREISSIMKIGYGETEFICTTQAKII